MHMRGLRAQLFTTLVENFPQDKKTAFIHIAGA